MITGIIAAPIVGVVVQLMDSMCVKRITIYKTSLLGVQTKQLEQKSGFWALCSLRIP
jgi:hypothetical protein